jgi:carbon-monoxide dehydrogenase small subunit
VSTKVGPISAAFEGEAIITADPVGLSGLISGKGIDKKGGSRGTVEVRYQIEPTTIGSVVSLTADLTLAGAIAQFGRTGLINEMSNTLIGRFTECLEGKLAASSTHEAAAITAGQVNGFGLFMKSLWLWVRGRVRRILSKA